MQIRCTEWQLGFIGKPRVNVQRNMKHSPQFRVKELNIRHISTRISSRPSIPAPANAQLVARSAVPESEIEPSHLAKGLPFASSRTAFDAAVGVSTHSQNTSRFSATLFHKPGLARHLSTSSTTASRAGVSHSIREIAAGHSAATISVVNPSKMNIVNSSVLEQLIDTCKKLSMLDSLRVVVLTGGPTAEGKAPAFIGGADIKEMNALSSSQEARTFIDKIHSACQALRDIPVPVIARVHGFSLGAGLELMAACDLRIATKGSTFGMPEVKVGIPSVVEAALLPGLIGMGRTRKLLYLAENISAKEAFEWGLVEKVVEDEAALDLAVEEWVETISGMGPKSIRIQKSLMQSWENSTVVDGIKAGVEAFGEAYSDGGKEPKEFMSSFINRKR